MGEQLTETLFQTLQAALTEFPSLDAIESWQP
jgi:hypothetical protein